MHRIIALNLVSNPVGGRNMPYCLLFPLGFLPPSIEPSDSLCRCASDGAVLGRKKSPLDEHRHKRPYLFKDSSNEEQGISLVTLAILVPKDSSLAATGTKDAVEFNHQLLKIPQLRASPRMNLAEAFLGGYSDIVNNFYCTPQR
jgi:hypothetical protein